MDPAFLVLCIRILLFSKYWHWLKNPLVTPTKKEHNWSQGHLTVKQLSPSIKRSLDPIVCLWHNVYMWESTVTFCTRSHNLRQKVKRTFRVENQYTVKSPRTSGTKLKNDTWKPLHRFVLWVFIHSHLLMHSATFQLPGWEPQCLDNCVDLL